MEENADDREDGNYCRERGKVQGKEKKGGHVAPCEEGEQREIVIHLSTEIKLYLVLQNYTAVTVSLNDENLQIFNENTQNKMVNEGQKINIFI